MYCLGKIKSGSLYIVYRLPLSVSFYTCAEYYFLLAMNSSIDFGVPSLTVER